MGLVVEVEEVLVELDIRALWLLFHARLESTSLWTRLKRERKFLKRLAPS